MKGDQTCKSCCSTSDASLTALIDELAEIKVLLKVLLPQDLIFWVPLPFSSGLHHHYLSSVLSRHLFNLLATSVSVCLIHRKQNSYTEQCITLFLWRSRGAWDPLESVAQVKSKWWLLKPGLAMVRQHLLLFSWAGLHALSASRQDSPVMETVVDRIFPWWTSQLCLTDV